MKPGPAAVADWVLTSLDHLAPPMEATELIIAVGNEKGWFTSPAEATDRASAWKQGLLKRLRTALTELREIEHPVRFDFNSSNPEMIQGDCYPNSADSPELVRSKESRSHADCYRDEVRLLTATDFEAICRGILGLIGCQNPILTRTSGDQGIDVFGEFTMRGRLDVTYLLGGPDSMMNFWIMGQAKHYTGEIGPDQIREFIGAQDLARRGVGYDNGEALAALNAKPYQAVHLFFLTTGRITRGAWTLAKRTGMIVFDEERIAALLADHEVATDSNLFSPENLREWVRANS